MSALAPPTDDWHPLSLGRGGCARPAPGRGLPVFPRSLAQPSRAAPALWAGEGVPSRPGCVQVCARGLCPLLPHLCHWLCSPRPWGLCPAQCPGVKRACWRGPAGLREPPSTIALPTVKPQPGSLGTPACVGCSGCVLRPWTRNFSRPDFWVLPPRASGLSFLLCKVVVWWAVPWRVSRGQGPGPSNHLPLSRLQCPSSSSTLPGI